MKKLPWRNARRQDREIRWRWWAAGALALLAAASARAEAPSYRACMIDEPPWGDIKDPGGSIYAEVFKKIARLTGTAITSSPTPLARVLYDVESGECAFTITSWALGRSGQVVRGEVLAELDYGVVGRSGMSLTRYDDLAGLTAALPRGLLIGDPFDHDDRIMKNFVYGYEQAIIMTEGGHADFAVGSIPTLRRIIALRGAAGRFGAALVLAKVPLALQMNDAFARTAGAKAVDRAVATLRQSGEADRIIAEHFRVADAERQPQR